MYHNIFPFHNLTNFELTQILEKPNKRIQKILMKNDFKKYVCDTLGYGMDDNFQCSYYTEDSLGDVLKKNKLSLTVININIRSLDRNFSDLLGLLYSLDHPIDVITITEIGKKNVLNRINMLRDKYDCEHVLPKTKKYGGACIFVRKNINYHVREDLSVVSDDVEDVWLEAEVNDQKLVIGSVYRHPGTSLNAFVASLEKTLQKIDNECCNSLVCGDFNADGLKLDANKGTADFYNCLMTYNYVPSITLPTRITDTTITLIDNIFMKINKKNVNDKVLSGNIYSDISDHLPNFITIQSHKSTFTENFQKKVRIYGEKNIEKFVNRISNIDWSDFFNSDDVNHMVEFFYNNYSTHFENSFPLKTLSRKRAKDKIWITAGLKQSVKKKAELYRKYLNHPTVENKQAYTSFKNCLTKLLRKAEADYYLEKVDAKKKNIRSLWQIFGPIINPGKAKKSNKIEKIQVRDNILTDKNDIANALKDYFINIGPQLRKKTVNSNDFQQYLRNNQTNSFYLHPTAPTEISSLISKLDINKSPGDDGISGKLLKSCTILFSKLISHLANKIMITGKYPNKLKLGKIIPIHKKNNKIDPTNYRPICLLSVINKIIEKVLHKRLYEYFEKYKIIYQYQFGFRHSYSTTMALIEITDQLREQIENKNVTIGIYIDLTKAFDLVDHRMLITKLESYGIRGPAIELIRSYLSDRSQFTQIDHAKSNIKRVSCGVPQGSVLGPLFFLIFVNDMQNCTTANLRLFADDTNIFISHKDPKTLKQEAETCINNITKWLIANKLLLSEEKTNFSIFMPSNQKIPDILNTIKVNGRTVHRSDSCKYLGVQLDDKLKFKEHIDLLNKDLIKIISAFRIIKDWVPNKHKLKLYHAYFHSKMQYGLEIYGGAPAKYISKIETLQHQAIKVLFNLDYLTPSRNLYFKYKVLPARDICSLKIAKFVHNQLSGDQSNVFSSYFKTVANDSYPNTRNRQKLRIPRSNTVDGDKMIRRKGARIWNSLTDALKQNLRATSKFTFNKKVKNHYLNRYST